LAASDELAFDGDALDGEPIHSLQSKGRAKVNEMEKHNFHFDAAWRPMSPYEIIETKCTDRQKASPLE
jgi:hypothetical protein